jgi:uncharacterized protein (TIGR00269 family)
MPQHKLALCQDHYVEWVLNRTEETIRSFKMFSRGDKVLVAVSGGKDSLSLWDILLRLGYEADGMYINLGIGGEYSLKSQECAQTFADAHPQSELIVVDIKEIYGMSVPELARSRRKGRGRKVCSLCGLIKRHEMNRVASEREYDVIVTGHNLDDEAATLLGNILNWKVEYLEHQYPLLASTHPGLARKARPLCKFYEREMAAYALIRGIQYIYEECPHAVGAKSILYKELLNRLEMEMPGTKQRLYLDFLRAKERGAIRFQPPPMGELHPCEICGQPTSAPGKCAFCRLWETAER